MRLSTIILIISFSSLITFALDYSEITMTLLLLILILIIFRVWLDEEKEIVKLIGEESGKEM